MHTFQSSKSQWSFIALFLGLLLFVLPTVVIAEPSVQDLVAGLDKKALHAALHESSNGKYKHGVFQGDIDALVAMHKSAPAEAARIIQLVKRQSNATIPITTHISGEVYTSTSIAAQYTTTLPNGQKSTITSVVLVVATAGSESNSGGSPNNNGGSGPSSTTTGSSSLQTNAADKSFALTFGSLLGVTAVVGMALL